MDTGITDAYTSCTGSQDANTASIFDCRVEHLGRITDGDSATQNQHCPHAGPVSTGPCAGDNPLVEPADEEGEGGGEEEEEDIDEDDILAAGASAFGRAGTAVVLTFAFLSLLQAVQAF